MNFRIQTRLCALVIVLVALAPAAWARWQPGLLGGWINNYNAANNDWITVTEPDANSGWIVYSDPHAATNSYNSPSSTTCPPIWAANRTWIYKGQMYLSKGTHWFCGQIDDARYLAINGTQYMKNTSWNTCVVSSPGYTVSSDAGEWVDIEIRFGNGGGGSGCVANVFDANGLLCGFGHAISDTAPSASMANFIYPRDPGDGSVFRYDDGHGFLDSVIVTGTPAEYGVPSPDYGEHCGFADGVTYEMAAPATVSLGGGRAVHCAGWTIYTNDVFKSSGTTTNLAYVHSTASNYTVLEWKWDNLVAASATAGGSVSPTQTYVAPDGPDITLTATPDPGYAFLCWSGDVVRPSDVTSPVITVPPNVSRSLVAVFTNGVPHPRYSGGFGDGFDVAEGTGSLGGVQIGFDSAARQIIERTFRAVEAETFTIRDGTPPAIAAGEVAITIPDSLPLTWDTSVATAVTTGPLGPSVTYRNGGKTAVLPASSFGGGEATVSGLVFTNATDFAFPERLSIDIDGDGLADAYSSGIVGVTVSRPGVAGSGSTFAENAEAQPVHVPQATMLLLR